MVVWALASVTGVACANTVHKCIGPGGAVSYQDAPCAAGLREGGRWAADPEPPPTPAQMQARDRKLQQDRAESDFLSRRAGTDRVGSGRAQTSRAVRNPAPSACEAAKAARQKTLDSVGLKRTFDLLRKLDEQVREACR
ncbi:hypothetical protein QLQ15_13780 [Lysobacter sp. LF1]|uniref:DUF4124 domain-containing protein n=1 Tax=Lysobacter stagni TaxID=3045172 RepID=A0ABT6XIT9_9GAMM|nr:hypothetical protein [Lysobacter sp. LF1]MDI9239978.1 hypothetical protein [Lysobacter sp. LF1]